MDSIDAMHVISGCSLRRNWLVWPQEILNKSCWSQKRHLISRQPSYSWGHIIAHICVCRLAVSSSMLIIAVCVVSFTHTNILNFFKPARRIFQMDVLMSTTFSGSNSKLSYRRRTKHVEVVELRVRIQQQE